MSTLLLVVLGAVACLAVGAALAVVAIRVQGVHDRTPDAPEAAPAPPVQHVVIHLDPPTATPRSIPADVTVLSVTTPGRPR